MFLRCKKFCQIFNIAFFPVLSYAITNSAERFRPTIPKGRCTMSVFCTNCGFEVADYSVNFCPNCGSAMGAAAQQAAQSDNGDTLGKVIGAAVGLSILNNMTRRRRPRRHSLLEVLLHPTCRHHGPLPGHIAHGRRAFRGPGFGGPGFGGPGRRGPGGHGHGGHGRRR